MKLLLGILWCILLCSKTNAQLNKPDSVRFYTLEEVRGANPDTIYALDLSRERLKVLPKELRRFTQVKYLDLHRNKLQDIKGLEKLTQLVYLDVGKNKLTIFPIEVCQFVNLEVLRLYRNEIYFMPSCISNCSNLRILDFWATPITDLPEELTEISSIEHVDYSGVRMNVNMQQKIERLFPEAKIKLDPPCACME